MPRLGGVSRTRLRSVSAAALDGAVVLGQALGVALGEARELLLRVGGRRAELEVLSVGQRQEVGERALDDLQAVLGEPQVADHLGIEEAHRVGGGGVAEARREFLGDRRAADHGAGARARGP